MSGLKLFDQLQMGMRWAARRSEQLIENLAKQEFPGYKAKDIKPLSDKTMSDKTGLLATSPQHMGFQSAAQGFQIFEIDAEPSLSGNTVHPEAQKTALTESVNFYMNMVNLYKSTSSRAVAAIQSLV